MKFFRLDLLTLLISLFILNGCKNENTIGLKPGSQNLTGTLVDTASVYTNTDHDDTVATSALTKTPLGLLNDPLFGTTESDLATDLNLPGSSDYTIPVGIIHIDSALLVLKYADGFYGDSTVTSSYTINVFQLGERYLPNPTYYDNKNWIVTSNLLGSKSFQPKPKTHLKVDTIITGGPDTLVKTSPEVRIPISTSFINNNVFSKGGGIILNNLVFANAVNGLYISTKTTGLGGIMMIKSDSVALDVYIRSVNGTVVDTSLVELSIAHNAAHITHIYPTTIQKALNNTKQSTISGTIAAPDNYVYLQGTAGLRSKITFPYLQKLFSSVPGGISNVIINRAELVVTDASVSGDIPAYLVPLPKITLYRYDITHQSFTIEDASSGTGVFFGVDEFGGFYNLNTKNYHFLITAYLQNIINGTTVDYGTYMGAVDTTNTSSVDIAPTPAVAARTIAYGFNKSNPYSIKLNIIYTKIKP